jgi:hypothetical protein
MTIHSTGDVGLSVNVGQVACGMAGGWRARASPRFEGSYTIKPGAARARYNSTELPAAAAGHVRL